MTTTTKDSSFDQAILRKLEESAKASKSFFQSNLPIVSELAQVMAEHFSQGGKLFVAGNGGSSCDAEHIVVEFMHPIFEKRKPLPAISLCTQNALVTAIANDIDFSQIFSLQIEKLGSPGDMLLVLSTSGMSANLIAACKQAGKQNMLTIAFGGKDGGRLQELADYSLVVPSYSIHRIQEAHVLLLHILWDLVHLALGEEDIQ